ncbi:fumarylacetoacetate hydrolase family protein [Neotabrizicola sp. sgz301269]|uniref:fumarylacetoacetate hydrolase family protein n=1 Tax=Neotabrizicola sp. sgz301269 TaxID=3276282 RepID=UPI00376F6C9A
MQIRLGAADILPADPTALLLGRVWAQASGGPCPILVRRGQVFDLSRVSPTVAGLLEREFLTEDLEDDFPLLGELDEFLAQGGNEGPVGRLLAPCDLQPVKAAGVTFAGSMIERVIEERAKGEPARAEALRGELAEILGGNLRGVVPGSAKAAEVKAHLQKAGLWSQYLEVGIGADAEIFTKAPPMSSLGSGAQIGVHPASVWNNPEPEVVLAINSRGIICGAALGNDVNLRDVEGRSALLLGKAKDNNGACAIGPFLRLFTPDFPRERLESLKLTLKVEGEDGFILQASSDMSQISRPPADIAEQTLNLNHQYPDGVMLFLGTMFAPVQDRDGKGQGFTHHWGDRVEISCPELGRLVNEVQPSDRIAPWSFGLRALMENLSHRGLL